MTSARSRLPVAPMSPLLAPTPKDWLPRALAALNDVLIDHAHCEKKAASHALTLISQYPEVQSIIRPLIGLAQEELRHFRQVVLLLEGRGVALTIDGGDVYVKALMREARHSRMARLVDRLLIASLVEARSAERLALLAHGLGTLHTDDQKLAAFYNKLAHTEAGHHTLFVRLAKKVDEAAAVEQRLSELAEAESACMLEQPILPRIH